MSTTESIESSSQTSRGRGHLQRAGKWARAAGPVVALLLLIVLGAALLIAAEIPVVTSHTFYDLGHLLAVLYGALAATLLLALAPPRQISDGGAVLAGRERAATGRARRSSRPGRR